MIKNNMISSDFDVICVGNAKIDTFLTLHEATQHLRFLKETNELCIKFGEKIAVDKAEVLLGGNAANVAVGASRLGLSTALVAEIGKDEFAQKIINTLKSENVDVSNVQQTEEQQSSFSTIINFRNERTIFSEHVKRSHNFDFENISAKWVYLTSLGEEWKSAYDKTVDFVKKNNCQLAFNPGTLQIESGENNIQKILSLTNILFVNKEEAVQVLSIKNKVLSIEEILKELQKIGPKIVVITDGENGSFAIDEKGNIHKKGTIETDIVEKTGAGDAYSSGFLGAIINNKSVDEAMEWGTKNSASVIGKVGSQAGLLHKFDLQKNNV